MKTENESAATRLGDDVPLKELWQLYDEVTSALIHSIAARLAIADERLQLLHGLKHRRSRIQRSG